MEFLKKWKRVLIGLVVLALTPVWVYIGAIIWGIGDLIISVGPIAFNQYVWSPVKSLIAMFCLSLILVGCASAPKQPPAYVMNLAQQIQDQAAANPTQQITCTSKPITDINGNYSHHAVACH